MNYSSMVASLQDPYLLVFTPFCSPLPRCTRWIWQKWWYVISKIRKGPVVSISVTLFFFFTPLDHSLWGEASCCVVSSPMEISMLWWTETLTTTMWVKLKVVPSVQSGLCYDCSPSWHLHYRRMRHSAPEPPIKATFEFLILNCKILIV